MNKLYLFSKEKRLWQWFEEHRKMFEHDEIDDQTLNEFHEKLSGVHPSLVFEIGPKDKDDTYTMVISCDGMKEGIPSVEKVASSAPNIKGWKVVAFRPAIKGSLTIEAEDMKLSTDDILFEYADNPDGTIDVILYIEGVDEQNKDNYLRAAFVLLDAAVGEYLAMTKIRNLDLRPLLTPSKSLQSLIKLKDILN